MAETVYRRKEQVNRELLMNPSLKRQYDVFSGLMADLFFPRRSSRDIEMKRAMQMTSDFQEIIFSRNERSQEVQMGEVKEAAVIANGLYTHPVFQTLCIDGRVLPVFVGGFSAGIGGSIRTPAGDLKEVVKDRKGGNKILTGSNIDIMLDEAFKKNDEINELLDSHVSCAAKTKGETDRGKKPSDGGLLQDVKRKMDIAEAMIKHVEEKFHGKKKVNPIQISFDPHNGYAYMGLETPEALRIGEKRKGYDPDTLEELVLDGKVLSTHALSFDTTIKRAFESRLFTPDWKTQYPETAYQLWSNIYEMSDELLPIIVKKIMSIYGSFMPPNEVHDRALLLLTNAYSGFLHNYEQKEYPHGKHMEAGINITVGMHGPHEMPLFAVNDHDIDNLPGNTAFAATIVRANREAGRVVSGILEGQDFVEAPIPLMVTETVKNSNLTWKNIGDIDFSDLPFVDWFRMKDFEFEDYLIEKSPNIDAIEVRAINNLRKKMIRLYTPRVPTSEQFMRSDLVPLPVITDKNREIKAVIPFFIPGY